MKRPTPQLGDIVELRTNRGFAYAQYTHEHHDYGSLLRILPGFFEETPKELDLLAEGRTVFHAFVPLKASLREQALRTVGHYPIPEKATTFPTFRSGMSQPGGIRVRVWFLWDGEEDTRVDQLSASQLQFPIREIITPALLRQRLEAGWLPESDARYEPIKGGSS